MLKTIPDFDQCCRMYSLTPGKRLGFIVPKYLDPSTDWYWLWLPAPQLIISFYFNKSTQTFTPLLTLDL